MTWLLICCMALITFSNRYLFFASSIHYSPSPKLQRFLSYSAVSVLTAIWAPIVFQYDGQYSFEAAGFDYLVGTSLAAILAFFRIQSMIVVILSVTVFFLLRFF